MIGLIGKKVGMTQTFDDSGLLTPVTVIEIKNNYVIAQRKADKEGYNAVLLGAYEMKKKRVKKPYSGQFPENITPKKHLREIRDFDIDCNIGDKLGIELLEDLRFVDIIGTTKGKGYQGVVKRHGFRGGKRSHGSKFHREAGSTGMAASPSKVYRGTGMPGRMGAERRTVQNLRVVKVDKDKQIILVKGAVPGRRGGLVIVKNAKKKE
ncbi:MAG: 50S ribosomal protein L3 [Spirochaetes bacterium]|nr:MAG: 50S ribosomal protein L3 [Spirochaetota bacterium]